MSETVIENTPSQLQLKQLHNNALHLLEDLIHLKELHLENRITSELSDLEDHFFDLMQTFKDIDCDLLNLIMQLDLSNLNTKNLYCRTRKHLGNCFSLMER